jgi:catechol 2,3-dioxygenase-like lactoylglutathione lyase family enzyme
VSLTPFHIAFPVDDLAAARAFYGDLLGRPEGRSPLPRYLRVRMAYQKTAAMPKTTAGNPIASATGIGCDLGSDSRGAK